MLLFGTVYWPLIGKDLVVLYGTYKKWVSQGSITSRVAAYHGDWWLQAEALLNHGSEVSHTVDHLERNWGLIVASANTILFFANFGENLGVVR